MPRARPAAENKTSGYHGLCSPADWSAAMPLALNLDAIAKLPHAPVSDVKKIGCMTAVARSGKLVVTHHNAPDAVMLSIADYDTIVQALRDAAMPREAMLDALRQRFDERLAVVQTDDAGGRLRTLLRQPAKLGGEARVAARH
ncbi:MAG: hypothetical protein COW59_13425 [Lysobacterales bacterium CG17_big_fil_post_rev_8_21_14_2_50_64_11]|nr:MAG: hypothetical protein COW59_13425 [Xanthomonadales bacterium CG17_big_fil_post_rev_8_21_14_2_50_64_11]